SSQLLEFAFHGLTTSALPVTRWPRPSAVCTEATPWKAGAAGAEARTTPCVVRAAGSVGGFDSVFDAPSAKTWSCEAWRPPPDEVAVPPTVVATYSLPPSS